MPHEPPPSLLQAGHLTRLLVDPGASQIDYVNVAVIVRRANKEDQPLGNEANQQSIQNSLQSFRVLTAANV